MKYLSCFLMILFSCLVQAKTEVSFVPKTVKQGDAVELVLSSDQPFQGVPNLDVLQNDFVIGGQQKKQSAQWINGQGSTTYQLIYTLFPNKSGDITVKGLKIGSELLPEVTLKVSKDALYETKGNLALSVTCPHTALYPSQKLLCQVDLTDEVGLVDGEIFAPETAAGTWEQVLPLMPASQASTQKTYQSLFAFTPAKSGQIEVPPFTFKGAVRVKTSGPIRANSMFDLMILGFGNTATKPVVVQSKPIRLTVKEKPSDYQGWWLPSPKVTLSEQYDMPTPLHSGEPITRTLTLFAENVAAANLPVPSVPQTAGFKIYTNPEQRTDLPNGAQLSVSITFVPTESGSLVLPAITVPWFNTQSEKIEQASVPAKEVFVTATEVPAVPSVVHNAPLKQAEPVIQGEAPLQSAEPVQKSNQNPVAFSWIWIALAIVLAFLGGILVTILIVKKRQNKGQDSQKKKPLPDLYPF